MKRDIKKLKKFQKWFDKFVVRNYGKKCSDFVWNCACCRAHFVKESFGSFVDDLIDIETWCKKQTQKKQRIRTKKILTRK